MSNPNTLYEPEQCDNCYGTIDKEGGEHFCCECDSPISEKTCKETKGMCLSCLWIFANY